MCRIDDPIRFEFYVGSYLYVPSGALKSLAVGGRREAGHVPRFIMRFALR